tara:strand:+ start:18329 stop:19363 length:1035 start_codon:yes stop_codon:yes gene_type:complete
MDKIFCITGVSGQDGSYAAEILLEIGCTVIGLTRNKSKKYKNLINIINKNGFKLIETNYSENSLSEIINLNNVSHIINFCGQSYVSKSWEMIEETIFSKSLIVSRIINIIRKSAKEIRLLNACSSEIFGESDSTIDEFSNLSPCNPYGSSQLLSFSLIKSIREYANIWASSAILFPHESLRRDDNFLFMRILHQVDAVNENKSNSIDIGNDFVIRDWGFALDFVYCMILMILSDVPEDLCICTGQGNTVKEFTKSICEEYQIDYDNVININKSLSRSYEPVKIIGNNKKLLKTLSIEPPLKMRETIKTIISNRKRLMLDKEVIDKSTDYISENKFKILKNLIFN